MEESISRHWLNKSFLESCLNGGGDGTSDIRISCFEVKPGVAIGNNYGSEILRVTVTYTRGENTSEETLSLILKGPIQSTLVDFMEEVFGMAEFNFYYKYMPRVREISKVQLAPKSYFSPLNSVVVLEDLKRLGFDMADRNEQLDLDHCKRYFTVSGKLHALGVALMKKHPELAEMFSNSKDTLRKNEKKSRILWRTILVGLNCLVNSVDALNLKEYKRYIDIIIDLIKFDGQKLKILEKYSLQLQEHQFKSLIHGDCWTTNMMFKYNESRYCLKIIP